MRNIKMIIEYDGTSYCGWQRQPNGDTIQEIIENSLKKITGQDINLIASGRTDAGVHAVQQVANFRTESNIAVDKLALALNSVLPKDISVVYTVDVDEDFHAQYDALRKTYVYKILNRRFRSSINLNRVWHIPDNLNIKLMNSAARSLKGKHDFSVFSKSGSTVKTTTREIFEAYFISVSNEILEFHITSNGFLKGMVRLIVGTLVNVGREKLSVNDFKHILKSGMKNKFVKSAPPHGLYLAKVEYKC